MKAAPRTCNRCSFCGRDIEHAGLLFRSSIGGLPPIICSDCVDLFADITKLHRVDPEAAGRAIAALNETVRR